jgi:hypothetical protein
MSANESGAMLRSSARIGPPSSWNTPNVSPRERSSKGFLIVKRQIFENYLNILICFDIK